MTSNILKNTPIILSIYIYVLCLSGILWLCYENDDYNLMSLSYLVSLIVIIVLVLFFLRKIIFSLCEDIGELFRFTLVLLMGYFLFKIISMLVNLSAVVTLIAPYHSIAYRETNEYKIIDGPVISDGRGGYDADQEFVYVNDTYFTPVYKSQSKKIEQIKTELRKDYDFVKTTGYLFWQTAALKGKEIDIEISNENASLSYFYGGFLIILEDFLVSFILFVCTFLPLNYAINKKI
jgi:hypothetical protein